MKAIILAAGKGTRLDKYTTDMPKGMLIFSGKTLIERQLDTLRGAGIKPVIIITGYKAEKIDYENVIYYHNPLFETTNMVESLFCAESEFDDDIILSYADIIYEPKILEGLLAIREEIAVTVDIDWTTYWSIRYEDPLQDTESLIINRDSSIRQLGEEDVGYDKIDGRYVGLMKFTRNGLSALSTVYHDNREKYWDRPWKTSGKIFQQAYMTDLLQAMIDSGYKVQTYQINNGWLEFDTNEDYEKMCDLLSKKTLSRLIDLKE